MIGALPEQAGSGTVDSRTEFGGDMSTTDKSILERVAARMKEIVGIAEAAAKHALEAEKPRRPKQRVSDLMEG